jgi:hypothetical protein
MSKSQHTDAQFVNDECCGCDLIKVHNLPADPEWLERHPEVMEAVVTAVMNSAYCLTCGEPLRPLTRRPVLAVISPLSVTDRTYVGFSCEHCYDADADEAPHRAAQALRDYVYDRPGRVLLVGCDGDTVH